MRSFILCAHILIYLFIGNASFAKSGNKPINLDLLKAELLERHPIIKEYKHRISSQQAHLKVAKSPSDPRVGVELITNDYPGNFGSIGDLPNNMLRINASKELKVLGKLSLIEDAESFETQKIEEDLKLAALILKSELKQKYYELFFMDKSIEIYEKIQKLLRSIEGSVKSKYEVGQGTQYDLIRVQLENTKVIEKLETLKKDRLTKITEINALAIRPINQDLNPNYEDITVNGLLLKPLDEVKILEISKENYPKLLSQAAVVDKVMAQVQLAKKEYIPDLNVNAFYGFRNNSDFGSLFGIGLETSLPVFFNSKQRQKVLEAKELVQAQKERLEDIKINTLSSARKLFIQIQKSQILTDILDTALLPQSNLAVESSMATYKVGKTDFPSVLDSINDLLEFQIQYYMELSMGLKSIAVLEPLLGKEIGDFN